ncbi:hypothetical protein [Sphingobacterium faecium]|uniref:hypothetical protein n=1 Tax=Sphingobacterium faecium TaxID=34087 RepID=UPI00320A8E99
MELIQINLILPQQLRKLIGDQTSVEIMGDKIYDVIEQLDLVYPTFKERLIDEDGEIKPYFNLFLGTLNIKDLEGIETKIYQGDTIRLILSRAGG